MRRQKRTVLGIILTAFGLFASSNRAAAQTNTTPATTIQLGLQGTIALSIDAVCSGSDKTVHDDATAFLFDEAGTFLTAAHAIPACDSYKTLVIEGELRPPVSLKKGPEKLQLDVINRSSSYDVAILALVGKTPNPIVGKALPLSNDSLSKNNIGDNVAIVGYPIQQTSKGYLSTLSGSGEGGLLEANQIIEKGFSGAPVLTADGHVIGMIRGGRKIQDVPNDSAALGYAQFVPIADILPALTKAAVSRWSGVTAAPGSIEKAPIIISKSLDVTRETHGISETEGSYPPLVVAALPGYTITKAQFQSFSETRVTKNIHIAADGSFAEMTFSLRSGPFFDQYRGWIKGSLVVTMVPQAAPVVPVSNAAPKTIAQHVDVTRDVHDASPSEEQYPPVVITAPSGYYIASADFNSQSETRSKRHIDIVPDGSRAVLIFSLQSGPFYDRYRGWIKGDFIAKLASREQPNP